MKPRTLLSFLSLVFLLASVSQADVSVNETWVGYTDNVNLGGVAVQPGTRLSGNWTVTNASAGVAAQNNGAGDFKTYTAGAGATEFTFSGNYAEPLNDFQDAILSAATGAPITGDVYFRFSFFLSLLPTATGVTDSGIWMNLGTDKIGFYNNVNPSRIFVGTSPGAGTTSDFTMTTGVNAIVGKLTYSGGVYTSATVWLNPTSNRQTDLASLGTKIEGAALTAGLTEINTLSFGWEDRRANSIQGLGPVTLGSSFADIGIASGFGGYAAWRDAAFPEGTTPADRAPMVDFDNDGLSNLLEYGLGSDPSVATVAPAAQVVAVEGVNYLQIQWTRPDNRTDITTLGEASTDLIPSSWISAPGEVLTTIAPAGAGMETVTIRDAAPVSAHSVRFLRARVVLNAP